MRQLKDARGSGAVTPFRGGLTFLGIMKKRQNGTAAIEHHDDTLMLIKALEARIVELESWRRMTVWQRIVVWMKGLWA